ncbi:MAG: hypothetical protein K2Y37_14555 [Pirellulales bacterium]|nr:hypothetical protein [Pirellulales bacterium]
MSLRPHVLASLARRLEMLEDRSLLSAHGFGAGPAGLSHQPPPGGPPPLVATGLGGRGPSFSAPSAAPVAAQATLLGTQLSDDTTGASATVSYHSVGDHTRFAVIVRGAEPNATLDVTLGDTVVGQITTDTSGVGKLVLANNPRGDEQSLPDDFPTDVAVGTAVAVGPMSGALTKQPLTCATGQAGGLAAVLTDASNASAHGLAGVRTFATETELIVKVTGMAADSVLDVTVGSTVIGQLTTDSNGAGKVVFSTDPTDDEVQLPADTAAAIAAGTTVSVGSLSGELAVSRGHFGPRPGYRR